MKSCLVRISYPWPAEQAAKQIVVVDRVSETFEAKHAFGVKSYKVLAIPQGRNPGLRFANAFGVDGFADAMTPLAP